MISMSFDGEKKVAAAVEEFVEEAKTESSRLAPRNMGYAIIRHGAIASQGADSQSATYVSKRAANRRRRAAPNTNSRRPIAGQRKLARRSLSEASSYIWRRWTGRARMIGICQASGPAWYADARRAGNRSAAGGYIRKVWLRKYCDVGCAALSVPSQRGESLKTYYRIPCA